MLSNELFINMVKSSYSTCLLVSEENDEAITIDPDEQVNSFQFFKLILLNIFMVICL